VAGVPSGIWSVHPISFLGFFFLVRTNPIVYCAVRLFFSVFLLGVSFFSVPESCVEGADSTRVSSIVFF